MRALIAAAIGLAAALAIVLTVSAIGGPVGTTSPNPLLTTVPSAPGAITPGK
ncbi:SPW_0924 family protein [Streptomyces sp. NPDC020719]|uniref:SPW_0924 family protein n=1 Tax=unclassified Streptomyces TaxID=2593676 RepID=UPI0033E66063